MRLHRLYRFVMLAAAGGLVFQTAASCSTDAMNALTSSLSGAIGSAVTAEFANFVNQMITCPG